MWVKFSSTILEILFYIHRRRETPDSFSSSLHSRERIKMWLKKLIVVVFFCKLISSRMQEFGFDVNDILNENLMPMSLVMLEEGDKSDLRNLSLGCSNDDFKCATRHKIEKEDGTMLKAFSSMGFHRKMINNFLCSKFIAEQILDDLQPKRMNNRLGVAKSKSSPEVEFIANNSLSFSGGGGGRKSHMLYDEGSYEYKNWLAK